jgi:thiamine-phosphate pyrophosphorylase
MIQLRMKGPADAGAIDTARRLAGLCRRGRVPFIVNDRIEIALACGADGVHLGTGDISASTARALIGRDRILGLSVSAFAQTGRRDIKMADYIGAGPVYRTPIRPGAKATGILMLKRLRLRGKPVMAIGGIDADRARALALEGFRSAAVIRSVCSARDPAAATAGIKKALEAS